eukprot:TRINITY_DN7992_c0_g1_i3.p1 TRINITY_DN7992_c0_g1~~TRINITY_DN7992_c0_g1_i3.p1  ORF type:complete len:241 (+),score=43.03 TRINITY_DN7992_c0_g1_i3:27-725(+)
MADAEIAQFVEVTGATSEQAKQFLAQAGNDVNTAITLFLASQLPSDTAPPQAAPPSVPSAASSRSRPAPPRRTGGANIATFSSMNTADDDEDDDKPNEYYTGGHNSGLAVEGNPEEARKKLFERAQKEGQSYEDFMRERQASQQRFAGRGFTLGDDESASQAVGTSLQEAPKPKKPTAVSWPSVGLEPTRDLIGGCVLVCGGFEAVLGPTIAGTLTQVHADGPSIVIVLRRF